MVHDEYVVTLRTDGHAPPGKAPGRCTGRGKLSEDLVVALARKKIDVRDAIEVRVDRSPRELVEELRRARRAACCGRAASTVADRLGTTTPLPGVYAAGAHTGGGGWVPFVGLTAALVAEEIGPA